MVNHSLQVGAVLRGAQSDTERAALHEVRGPFVPACLPLLHLQHH